MPLARRGRSWSLKLLRGLSSASSFHSLVGYERSEVLSKDPDIVFRSPILWFDLSRFQSRVRKQERAPYGIDFAITAFWIA